MKGIRFVVSIAAFLLAVLPGTPLRAECTGRTELETYLKKQHPDCKNLQVLAFDHQNQVWLAGVWRKENGTCVLNEDAVAANLALDVNQKPRLSVGGDDRLQVAVYNTNPMVYAVDPGKTEEDDIETLAQFEQLARLLGGITQGALTLTQRFDAQRTAAFDSPQTRDSDLWKKVESAITPKITARREALRQVQSAQGDVAQSARDLEAVTHNVRAYLRGVETGTGVDRLIRDLGCLPGLSGRIDAAARKLAEVKTPSAECKASYSAANSALARKLNGFSQNNRNEEEVEFLTNLRLLERQRTGDDHCDANDQDALATLRDFLDSNRPGSAGTTLPPEQDEELKNIKSFIVEYLDLLARLDQLSTVTAELLKNAPAAAKSAQALETLRAREATALGETLPAAQADHRCTFSAAEARDIQERCTLSAGVLPVFSGDPRVRSLKFQKRKFAVKAAAPLAADIEKRHKDLDAVEYELDSSFINGFSFGVGVLYTDLADPSWTAVKNDAVADPKMVIQRKDEATRSGKPVLLMSFVPQQKDRVLRWGVDLGAAIDTDTSTALAGLSLGLGRFVRLGGGWAWSRVKELDGQKEFRLLADGTADPRSVVPNADAIRTRDTFEDDWYLSLTFSIDALPFFRDE